MMGECGGGGRHRRVQNRRLQSPSSLMFTGLEEIDASPLSQCLAFRGLGRSGGAYDHDRIQNEGRLPTRLLDQQHPPGELMYRRRNQLVAPTWADLRNWAIILFPEEQGRARKTGVFNDSITLDSHLIPFVSSISRELALGAADGQSPRSNGKQCCTTWG